MGFWKAILGLVRRRSLAIPLLGSALAVALAGYFLTPLQYVSSTTMVLVTPAVGRTLSQDPTVPVDLTNPMLSFSNDLKTASTILIWAMNTPEVAEQLGAVKRGPTKLTINDGRTNPNLIDGNGPFVYVVGESTSRAEARDIVIRAQERMRHELLDRQKSLGAPPETYLTMVDVVAPTTPKVTRSDKIKVGGIALALWFVFGLSVAYAWQAHRHRRAAGDPPPKLRDNSLDSRRDSDVHNDLDLAVEEQSQDLLALSADANLAYAPQGVEEGNRDVESRVTAEPQPLEDEQMADGEGEAVAVKHPTDGEYAGEAEQSADPEEVFDPSQEEELVEAWDLYVVEYPPNHRGLAPSSEHDQLDWGMGGVDTERRLTVVGANGGAAVVNNKQSLITPEDGFNQEEPGPKGLAAAVRQAMPGGGPRAEYRISEMLETNGRVRHEGLAGVDEEAVTAKRTADEGYRGVTEQTGAHPEQVDCPSQDEEPEEGWALYIAECPPTQEPPTPSSEHDQLDWSWRQGVDDESERSSVVVGAKEG